MNNCLSDTQKYTSARIKMETSSLLDTIISILSFPIKPSNLTFLDLLAVLICLFVAHFLRKIINYVYHQFQFVFIDDLFKDFSRPDIQPQPDGLYPNGWMPVAEKEQLATGAVLKVRALGRDFVLMRDSNGKVHAMDPYCPHNGAHLGGGDLVKIRGEACIRCPFHEWSFRAEDGVCVDVPYAKDRKSPKGSNLKVWPCIERNNFIYIWFHNGGKDPDWLPETLEDLESGEIAYCGRFENIIDCDPYLIVENVADNYHFVSIHLKPSLLGKLIKNFPFYNKFEEAYTDFSWTACESPQSHKAQARTEFVAHIRKWEILRSSVRIVHYGPYTFTTQLKTVFLGLISEVKLVVGIVPLHSRKQRYILQLYCGKGFLSQLMGRFNLLQFYCNIQGDCDIWQNMARLKKPIYLKEEKDMAKCNRWYSKFYDGADEDLIKSVNDHF
ncbi:cholesterol 7-desaturase nvd-like [Brevipalpus obovatus]|uniref:cholesterol 7-desaturase nvd-like n=1 Tax=Brevipalpus obovatus TaxID=246614 RepID=UPI003D9DFC7F